MFNMRESAASLQQKIHTIQDTLKQIEVIKKKLHENALQTKSHIQTAVSRQLESLRNREVWLFEQVQLLQATKQETLDKQTDDLWQTLGNLESCLRCVKSLDFNNTALAQHHLVNLNKAIEDCMKRFDSLELSAKENPYMSFKADVAALRTCIQKFGTIDAKGLTAVELAFAGVQSNSASLPRAFEEYEDDEHHIFYKPLGQSQMNGNIGTITLKVPNANLRPEDWLFIPTDITPVPPPPVLPPFQVNVDEWLVQKKVTASPSIQQWLKDLQSECDLEEESYDVVAGNPTACKRVSMGSQSDIEVISHCDVTDGMDEPMENDVEMGDQYFMRVLQAPNREWLVDGNLSNLTCPYLKMKYFAEISNNFRDWLQQYKEEYQDEDKDICCSGDRCGTASQQLDIENLHELTCVVQETDDGWLLHSTKDAAVADVCRANEPCPTFSECVSPEHCCSEHLKYPPPYTGLDKNHRKGIEEWLQKTSSSYHSETSQDSVTMKLFSDSVDQWLSSSSNNTSGFAAGLPKFAPFYEPDYSHNWLKYSANKSSDSGLPKAEAVAGSDIWLSKASETNSECSRFTPFSLGSSSDHWLKKEKVNHDNGTGAGKESNIHWLLKGISKEKTSQVDFAAFEPANEETFMETSWLLKSDFQTAESPFKKGFDMQKMSKIAELPECADNLVWLLNDKLNVKPEVSQIRLCSQVPNLDNSSYSHWLID